jgi:hypothetical protein
VPYVPQETIGSSTVPSQRLRRHSGWGDADSRFPPRFAGHPFPPGLRALFASGPRSPPISLDPVDRSQVEVHRGRLPSPANDDSQRPADHLQPDYREQVGAVGVDPDA